MKTLVLIEANIFYQEAAKFFGSKYRWNSQRLWNALQ